MTERILILADDFTGGNAASALFSQAGYRAVTLGWDRFIGIDAVPRRFDVVVVCTDSRHSAQDVATERVSKVLGEEGEHALVGVRIDSTLRGAVGPVTRTVLDAMRDRSERRVVAVCVPAYPSAGRHTVNGRQLLEGVALENTELAGDPLSPITTSDVVSVLAAGGLHGGLVTLSTVEGSRGELLTSLTTLAQTGDVIVVDATSADHLVTIADAVAELSRSVDVLTVDPGPFSVAFADALGLTSARRKWADAPSFGVVGSASELTAAQLKRLGSEPELRSIVAHFDPSGARLDVTAAAAELNRALSDVARGGRVVLSIARDRDSAEKLSVENINRLVADLAGVASNAMLQHPVAGVFCTGGDLTSALLSAWGASGIEVGHEILPLAVAGVVRGGRWDGLAVVTKGGMVGGDDAIVLSFEHLEGRRNRIIDGVRPSAEQETT